LTATPKTDRPSKGTETMRNPRERARVRAVLAAAILIATALAPAAGRAQQTDAPRRPQGPASGPAIKLPRGSGAEAETATQTEPATRPATSRRWEYCAITGFTWKQRGFSISSPQMPSAVIRYFPTNFEEVEGANEEDALANAFAKLGEDGWELAGVRQSLRLDDGDGETRHVYYFKRPKRGE
jgi:hypothetical protein